jgi:hypothetical protein
MMPAQVINSQARALQPHDGHCAGSVAGRVADVPAARASASLHALAE